MNQTKDNLELCEGKCWFWPKPEHWQLAELFCGDSAQSVVKFQLVNLLNKVVVLNYQNQLLTGMATALIVQEWHKYDKGKASWMHVKIEKIPRAAKYKQNVKQRHFGTCVTRIGWIIWSCFQWTLKAEIFKCKGRLWWDFQVRQEVMSLELLSELNKKSNRTSMDEGASGHNMMHRSMLIMYDQQ